MNLRCCFRVLLILTFVSGDRLAAQARINDGRPEPVPK
jgi:hypothetical protein